MGQTANNTSTTSGRWWWGREALLCLLVAMTLGYSWMFRRASAPNERSRIYLSVALVDHGTVAIDKPIDTFGGILDVAKVDGSHRSDKAPGAGLLGAVVYGAARLASAADAWTKSELLDLMRFWLMLPIGVAGFLLLRMVLRDIGLDPPAVDVASLAWILGSSAFHYSNAFFGHQIVAVGLLGAFVGLVRCQKRLSSGGKWAARAVAFGGGMAAGVAGMTEYPAAIPCIMIAMYATTVLIRRDVGSLAAFAAGALPFAVGLFVYHSVAFGGPLELPYFHLVNENFDEVHTSGLGGLKWPHLEWFSGGVFSLHRGWFGTSPFFVLIVPGLWLLWRRERRALCVTSGAIVLYYIAFIASWPLWEGGWGYGPRHLVAMMGVAMIPTAAGLAWCLRRWFASGLARGLVLLGLLGHQLVGALFPELPADSQNPLMEALAVMWNNGLVAPNWLTHYTDLSGVITLLPLAVLVGVVAGIVVGRGLIRHHRFRLRRIGVAFVCAATFLAGVAAVRSVGSDWDEKRVADFKELGEFFVREEAKLPR
jgi:hypothetical protein